MNNPSPPLYTLNKHIISNLLDASFREDFGIRGDITSEAILTDQQVRFSIVPRENIILCGIDIAKYYLDEYSSITYTVPSHDGAIVNAGDQIISGHGNAQEILLLERIMLNYLQHLSGIATLTNKYVQLVQGTQAKIYDTRKTIPMLRMLQKYAVRCGGGHNHRLTLDGSILIKDNHIAICGSLATAINKAKIARPHYTKIEVECDTLAQVITAVDSGADIIMLDNMCISDIIRAKAIISNNPTIITEVSGNVSLDNVRDIAQTGVDIISIGKITHSAPCTDIGLDIV